MRPIRTRRIVSVLAGLVAVLLGLSGCIGSITNEELATEIRERGGGVTPSVPAAAVAELQKKFPGVELKIRSLTIATPIPTVTLEVQVPGSPTDLDTYVYAEEELSPPTAVLLTSTDDLQAECFALSELTGLKILDKLVDTAIAKVGLADSWVENVTVRKPEVTGTNVDSSSSAVQIVVSVSSARGLGVAAFGADGTFLTSEQA